MTPASPSPNPDDFPHPTDRNDPAEPIDSTDHFRAEAQRLSKLAKARRERIRDLERELDRLRSHSPGSSPTIPETSDKVSSSRSTHENPVPSSSLTTGLNPSVSDRLTLRPTPPAPGGKRPAPREPAEPLRLRRHDLTDPRVMLATPARDLVDALRRGWAD